MDTDEIVLWVCLGLAVLLIMIFLVFAVSTGGIKMFVLYILFPLFVISFLVGMVLLVQLIIKLNDKLDGNTNGLNKKIDTNNFMIKDSIDNMDNYLQNVDYTVVVEDRNIIAVTEEELDKLGNDYRYIPKIYQPSLEIPSVKEVEISEDLDNLKNTHILSEENVKSIIDSDLGLSGSEAIIVEKDEPVMIQTLPIKQELLVENTIIDTEETLDKNSHDNSLLIEETINEDSLSINELLYESLSIDESINEDVDSLCESLSVNETVIEDLELDFDIFEDDNLSIFSNFCIDNMFEIKPLHEEFLFVYDLFE
jgi:hypothetical protein